MSKDNDGGKPLSQEEMMALELQIRMGEVNSLQQELGLVLDRLSVIPGQNEYRNNLQKYFENKFLTIRASLSAEDYEVMAMDVRNNLDSVKATVQDLEQQKKEQQKILEAKKNIQRSREMVETNLRSFETASAWFGEYFKTVRSAEKERKGVAMYFRSKVAEHLVGIQQTLKSADHQMQNIDRMALSDLDMLSKILKDSVVSTDSLKKEIAKWAAIPGNNANIADILNSEVLKFMPR